MKTHMFFIFSSLIILPSAVSLHISPRLSGLLSAQKKGGSVPTQCSL